MGIWQDRLALAAAGWNTDFRLSRHGVRKPEERRSVGLWARTWKWNGYVADVCLHTHLILPVDHAGPSVEFDMMSARLREACERARAEFTDVAPCMLPDPMEDGRIKLVANHMEAKHFRKQEQRGFTPDLISFSADEPDSGAYADVLASFIAVPELEYEDRLNNHAERRFIRDDQPAVWQFETRVMLPLQNGRRVTFRPVASATRLIDESSAAEMAAFSVRSLQRRFADYAPGGRLADLNPEGLPPGFTFLQSEPRQEQEIEP